MARTHLELAGGGRLKGHVPDGPCAAVRDWLDSQRAVVTIWLDRLIAEGDPDDLISLVHRQAAWLDLMTKKIG